jgi:hypothetical protein
MTSSASVDDRALERLLDAPSLRPAVEQIA